MNQIPLEDFVSDFGQQRAAQLLGVTQGAVSKALRKGRKIFVCVSEKGQFAAEEVRPFPANKETGE